MKLALCHGTFDLLHPGHVSVFNQARHLASRLIITVTADPYVKKGGGRPVQSHWDRVAMVRSYADQAYILWAKDAVEAIKHFKPDFFVKGGDYEKEDRLGNLSAERAAVESYGGCLVLIGHTGHSTSKLIEAIRGAC